MFRRLAGSGRVVSCKYRAMPGERFREGYFIRVKAAGRDRWRKGGDTKEDAELVLAGLKREAFEEAVLGVRPVKDMKFEAFAEEYLAAVEADHPPSTFHDECNKVRNLLVPRFKGRSVASITREDVTRFHTERGAAGCSIATRNRDLSLLSAMFRRAVDLGYARENPVAGFGRPQEDRKAVPALSREEQARLLAKCPDWLRPVALVALDTGLRRGEQAALEWGDVDLARGVLLVRESKNKTPREVPLTRRAREALQVIHAGRVVPLKGPDRVFTRHSMKSGHFLRAFQGVVEAAELPRLRWHDLRHLFAVNLVRAGVPLPDAAKLMGHRTLAMVWRYASHCRADSGGRAVAMLERAYSEDSITASDAVPTQAAGQVVAT